MKQRLILLHGALGNAAQLGHLAACLEDDFDLVVPDFIGHGKGQAGSPFDIPSMSQQLIYLYSGQPAIIFGYSMGGHVALHAATLRADLFKGVITLGTKFNWTAEDLQQELRMLDADKIREKVPQLAQVLSGRHGETHWPALMKETGRMMKQLSSNAVHTENAFRSIQHPVFILRGAMDTMVSADESRRIAESLSRGSYAELPETKHPIETADVASVAAIIRDFAATLV
jgi:pimeloyl-ACP methyl ester carboxylesterase